MLEVIFTFLLLDLIPDVLMAPIVVGGYAAFQDLKKEIQTEEALQDDCVIYVKDYTECDPEWHWGNSKDYVNFQEVIGFPLETIQKDLIKTGLRRVEKGKHGPTTDYTLKLYFRENICVKVEYWRPMNNQFLACYGQGTKFHVHSKFFVEDIPIDLTITYYDFLNFIQGEEPQMLITAQICGEAMPYAITTYCHCK